MGRFIVPRYSLTGLPETQDDVVESWAGTGCFFTGERVARRLDDAGSDFRVRDNLVDRYAKTSPQLTHEPTQSSVLRLGQRLATAVLISKLDAALLIMRPPRKLNYGTMNVYSI